ncbi:MAG: 2-amino-4-hydroxy-6-hydroxymethyldihydropteridine diphosphokinase [Acidiferrobacterales bacterium]
MPRVFVSIGSNIDREKNIKAAVHELNVSYAPLTLSRVYESPAIAFRGDDFYNLVASFDTNASVHDLRARLTSIEDACGRERRGNNQSRTLDIDLLLYGDLVRHDGEIDVPRPEISQHAFVLLPLTEIASKARHPETGVTFRQMWANFDDPKQKLWPVELDFSL